MTATAAPGTPTPPRTVPTRRVSFDYPLADLPKHFARDGDLVSSHLIPVLSSMFPDGEDFFVRSVRNYRDQVQDPDLKRQVAGFIGQEAIHGREHRAFNDRLAELGYPVKTFERFTKRGLEIRERLLPPSSNLAATAALEHFTATLAELILSNPEARDMIGNQAVTDLFVWHALEESEHKAVAFDVYKAVGGSERLRTFTMNLLTFGFLTGMSIRCSCRCSATARRTGGASCAAAWRGPPSPPSSPRSCGCASGTTTARTSTPMTTTPPSWWPAGEPSCSATPAPSTTSWCPPPHDGQHRIAAHEASIGRR
jgi:predicted metal-dependent hydrolase